MKYEFWQHDPVPIWGVETHQGEAFDPFVEPLLNLMVRHKGVTMRGVEIDRLPTILSTGIDVDPTDHVIYCEIGDKAYEYGGFPKVVMALRYRDDAGEQVLFPAFTTVYPTSSPESVAHARRLYPYEVRSDSEGRTTRCRVEPQSAAEASYLGSYGYFIPGSPWAALAAVFVYGRPQHLDAARRLVEAVAAPRT